MKAQERNAMERVLRVLKLCGLAAGLLILAAAFVHEFLPSAGWVSELADGVLDFFIWNPCAFVPIAVLAILMWVLRRGARPRVLPGHCQKCGYDLTGNESGRCPECGEPVESTTNQGQQ
jgi:hypothetical protein